MPLLGTYSSASIRGWSAGGGGGRYGLIQTLGPYSQNNYSLAGLNVDISLDGNTFAVGAPFQPSSPYYAGVVSVFSKQLNVWNSYPTTFSYEGVAQYETRSGFGQQVKVDTSGGVFEFGPASGRFGSSTVGVGYFKNINGRWVRQFSLTQTDGNETIRKYAVSNDGLLLVAEQDNVLTSGIEAIVYDFSSGQTIPTAIIDIPEVGGVNGINNYQAVSDDRLSFIWADSYNVNGVQPRIFLYTRPNLQSTVWTLASTTSLPTTVSLIQNVVASGDLNTVVLDYYNSNTNQWNTQVYSKTGLTYTYTATISVENTFGPVRISEDGNTILIQPSNTNIDVYRRGSGWAKTQSISVIPPPNTKSLVISPTISGDGNTIVVIYFDANYGFYGYYVNIYNLTS